MRKILAAWYLLPRCRGRVWVASVVSLGVLGPSGSGADPITVHPTAFLLLSGASLNC